MKSLLPVAIFACAASASAQLATDPGTSLPMTTDLVDAGVFNWSTKRWMSPDRVDRLRAVSTTVYNNTCTYANSNGQDDVGTCTKTFDEGRIPSTSDPLHPFGATDDNLIDSFQIAYCTYTATGLIDIKIGFYENWGGCLQNLGGLPWSGTLASNATGYFDLGAPTGYALPGDPSPGGLPTCNKVTIALGNAAFCMASDGDGIYDNVANLDAFAWSIESQTPGFTPGLAGIKVVRTGEPAYSPRGGCTYNIPCGTDPTPILSINTAGGPCGHGLGTEDHFWHNVDGDPWGVAGNNGPSTCIGIINNGAGGSGCYIFTGNPNNGYPNAPWASYWLTLGSAGGCSGPVGAAINYCTVGVTSGGCSPAMSFSGTPSASAATGFTLSVNNIDANRNGLMFYGLTDTTYVALPWGTGGTSFLCIRPPTQRTPVQSSGGTLGCTGTFAIDWNAFMANPVNVGALGNPRTPGAAFDAQVWFRDPPSPKSTMLTNGTRFVLGL